MKYSEIEKIVEHYKHGNMEKIRIFANFYINEWREEYEKAKEKKGMMSGRLNEEMLLLAEAIEFEEKYFCLFANFMSTSERQNHLGLYAKNIRRLYNMTMSSKEILVDAKNMLLNSIKEVRYSRSELGLIIKSIAIYKRELNEQWNLDEKLLLASKGFNVRNRNNNNILEK